VSIFSGEPIPKEKYMGCLVPMLIAVFLIWLALRPPGFSDEDIRHLEASIREEFEKQKGVKVTQISLSRKERSELIGIAKIKIDAPWASEELSKICTVTKTDRSSIWQCK
jgi:hypothetical protein